MGRSLATILLCAIAAAGPGAHVAAAPSPAPADSSAPGRYGVYLQIGGFSGTENTLVREYTESQYRLFFECGLKWTLPSTPGRTLESVLIGPCIAGGTGHGPGENDLRIGFGPTAVWRLHDRWRFHTMAGLARSNMAEGPGLGAQLRGSFVYHNTVAFDCLCQFVPVGDGRDKRVSSIYAGVTFHGKTGAWLTGGSVVLFGVGFAVAAFLIASAFKDMN